MMLMIIFSVAFVSVVSYLILFFRFSSRFPRMYPELWKDLGCPESLGLSGQSTYLAVVLGMESRAPLHALEKVRSEMLLIRVLLGLTVAAFVAAAFMTA